MQILITHGRLARTRSLHLSAWQLALGGLTIVAALLLVSGTVYHMIFLKAAREGWPVVSQIVRLVVRDETEQRDRFVRENLDVMARRVGEMQAKLIRLESVGERVSGLAGLKAEDLKVRDEAGSAAPRANGSNGVPARPSAGPQGGPYVPLQSPSMETLLGVVARLDAEAEMKTDVFTYIESRLTERRLQQLTVPSIAPVAGPIGSGFGFRHDPFTGRAALHTGLDFPADAGTPIHAAAGGVVLSTEGQGAYGQMVELDHGNGLVTRYAHTSKMLVRPGEVVKRGQQIALVGSTGRSTGPHLHFEVMLDGTHQNPARFLARTEPADALAEASPAQEKRRRRR
jgi:murein DD-endopeptidase MepM/ murein hydrolase activator NlpD